MVKFLVFKIAPVGSYGPVKIRSSSHIPSKVNGAPFEISKYKSDGVASAPDLYFEISNGAPFTLLGTWKELRILAGP